jgi:hypothetical protein
MFCSSGGGKNTKKVRFTFRLFLAYLSIFEKQAKKQQKSKAIVA